MALQVRKIQASEYARASEVVQTSFRHLAAQYQTAAGVAAITAIVQAEAIAERDTAGSVTYVALIQDVIIGVLQVCARHIKLLFVLPELQSRGVGRALIKAADADGVLQTVNASVNSVSAYMRYGFMPNGADQTAENGIRFIPMQRI